MHNYAWQVIEQSRVNFFVYPSNPPYRHNIRPSCRRTGFDLVWTTNVLRHVEFLRRLFRLTAQQKNNKQQPSSTMAAAGVAGPYGVSRRPMPAYDGFADSPRPHDPRTRRKSGGEGVEAAQTAARVGDACGRRRRSHDMHFRGRRK